MKHFRVCFRLIYVNEISDVPVRTGKGKGGKRKSGERGACNQYIKERNAEQIARDFLEYLGWEYDPALQ